MIIVIQCKDQVGLVAYIAAILAKQHLNIVSMREHVDQNEGLFFMRVEVDNNQEDQKLEQLLKRLLPEGAMVMVNPLPHKKVVVLVTKEYHCLADILIRNYFKTLGAT